MIVKRIPRSIHSLSFVYITFITRCLQQQKRKSKEIYSSLISKKAQPPSMAIKLQNEFNLTTIQIEQSFILPHTVALKPYLKSFQYKVLNSILYTHNKLNKIGFSTVDKCRFCKSNPETLHHLFYNCHHVRSFWRSFEQLRFSSTKEKISNTLQDAVLGILTKPCPSLNCPILIAKLYWF